MLNEREYKRWMDMARNTLDSVVNDLNKNFFNWACFKAQQASEFAVKALIYGIGIRIGGNSISTLLKRISKYVEAPKEILNIALKLDKLYIPTRYPDVWS